MPIKTNLDDYFKQVDARELGTSSKATEIHGECNLKVLKEYTGQSGKVSIQATFEHKGLEFSTYLPISEKVVARTLKTLGIIFTDGGIPMADYKPIFENIANEEFVNNEQDLALKLAYAANERLKRGLIKYKAYVDRVKDEKTGYWDTKVDWARKKVETPDINDKFFETVDA